MKIRYILGMVAVVLIAIFLVANSAPNVEARGIEITTYKSPTCGCCGIWASYASNQGFEVNRETITDVNAIKEDLGVPAQVYSCHTTEIEGYVVEGHVPIEAIDKLLEERPDIKGIALPDMPSGTPGMPGPKTEDWVIYAIANDGSLSEFMVI